MLWEGELMNCYKCGEKVNDEITLCPNCGTYLQATPELIQQAISNDQSAIESLYHIAYSNVYYTVHAMIKDPDTVLDLVQDSFIKGFNNLSQLKNPEKYCSWMKRIAHNHTIDYLRKTKSVAFSSITYSNSDEILDFEDDRIENIPEIAIDQKETARLIDNILNSLSEEQRVPIALYYYEQMSIKEIAHLLNCSENTVKSRLAYGRKKIELQVRELEKRGTKLYGLAPLPFFLCLFKNAATPIPPTLSSEIWQALSMADKPTALNNVKPTTASLTATKGFITKIILGITAAVTIGGGLFASFQNKETPYDWEKYVNETMIPSYGTIDDGTYQIDTMEHERFLTWEKEIHGLLNYSILDFDHDGENELLAVFLEPYANNNSGVQTPQKQLILRMYEHEYGTIKNTAEYKTFADPVDIGGSITENGVFLKEDKDKTYICISIYRYQYRTAWTIAETHILTYDRSFQEYTGTQEPICFIGDKASTPTGDVYSESQLAEMKNVVDQMARKLEDIGLTNSAKQMHETFMQRLDLTDASDDLLVYITGRDDRAYKYYGPYEGNESIASEDVEYYTAIFTYSGH